jgi:hypothetical protein
MRPLATARLRKKGVSTFSTSSAPLATGPQTESAAASCGIDVTNDSTTRSPEQRAPFSAISEPVCAAVLRRWVS